MTFLGCLKVVFMVKLFCLYPLGSHMFPFAFYVNLEKPRSLGEIRSLVEILCIYTALGLLPGE